MPINVGERGDHVKWLQWALNRQPSVNPKLREPVDGSYGPLTKEAVRQFQIAMGSYGGGTADDATLMMLGLPSGPLSRNTTPFPTGGNPPPTGGGGGAPPVNYQPPPPDDAAKKKQQQQLLLLGGIALVVVVVLTSSR